jgi:hypothetical protein
MQRQVLSVALVTAFLSAGLMAPTAQGVPVEEFDAPLLGSTASAQLTRMPSLNQIQCSDAACTTGLFPRASLNRVEYSTKRIMPDAGYTRVPEFVRGVLETWSDTTVQEGGVSFASFTIAEYQPGSDMRSVMTAIADLSGSQLTARVVEGTTVFVGETINASDEANNFSGTSFKSAYILGTDHLIRAGCQAGGSGVETSRCTVDNLIPLALSIANAQPQRSVPREQALKALAPTSVPAGLRPLVVASVGADQPWALEVSNKKLLAALEGQPTALAQYTLQGSPGMYVSTLTTPLTKPALARGLLNRPCTSVAGESSCTDRKIRGAQGVVTTFTENDQGGGVSAVTVQGVVNTSLLSFTCFKRVGVSGFLTKREVARCASLGSTMLK